MPQIQIIFEGQRLTQSRFNKIEKDVLEYFQSLWSDVKKSIDFLRKNNPALIKSEVCLAFIGADSLSRFSEIITTTKEEKNNESRFREWLDDFVFNDKNEVYKIHKKVINCDSFTAWKLRNSLLHFYGLPNLKNECIGFSNMNEGLIERFKGAMSKDYPGKRIRVINPYRLMEAVLIGFLTQAKILSEMIKSSKDSEKETYARGIVICYEIIQNEGSIYVPIQKK